jgi:hypothetical protein
MRDGFRKILSAKGARFTITLEQGITIKNAKVEYMSERIILLLLRNGDYKHIVPSEIINIEREK